MNHSKPILTATLLVTAMLTGALAAQAATFTVDTVADDATATACDDATANDCSLRGAILAANTLAQPTTIKVPAGTYVLSQSSTCTYKVKSSIPPGISTSSQIPLCLSRDITLQGAGAASTIINGDRRGRVLFVSGDAVAQLRGLTVTNGIGDATFSGIDGGGGIQNHGTLTLTDTVVSNNILPAGSNLAGGIHNLGVLAVNRSVVRDNGGSGIHNDGGRIYFNRVFAYPGPVLTVSESTIVNNTAIGFTANGGGIMNLAGGTTGSVVTIINSTVSGNTAGANGGGIANFDSGVSLEALLTVINSTISGNTSTFGGGGIYTRFGTSVDLNNVTITDNTAGDYINPPSVNGGGIQNVLGIVTLQNTLIAGNRDMGAVPAPDCYADVNSSPLTSRGHNLIQDTTRCTVLGDLTGNLTGVDPLLGPLADNGGLTKTHALLANSPAIDAGRPLPVPGGGGTACAATDQRGFPRAPCDIGAYDGFQGDLSLRVRPNSGGNAGLVIANIYGFDISGGATVKLTRPGEPDIVGNPVGFGGSSILSASLDLTGRPIGSWDVVVTGHDGSSATLPGGFTIEAARAPDLWTDIVGPPEIRLGRKTRFTVFFGNRGNVDAIGVPFSLSIPQGYAFSVFFPITPPPPQPTQVLERWDDIPVSVQTDEASGFLNVPFLLPVIPAGFAGSFQIELTAPSGGATMMLSGFGDPLFNPGLPADFGENAVAGAQAYLQDFDVTIPPAAIPELHEYVKTQYQQVVDRGRAAFIASLGTTLQIYSVSQLQFDLIFLAATRAAQNQASATLTSSFARLSDAAPFFALLSKLEPARAEAQSQSSPVVPCSGGVLGEGQSCTPAKEIFPVGVPLPPGCDLSKPATFKSCRPTDVHCESLETHKVVKTSDGAFCTPKKPPPGCPVSDNPILSLSSKSTCRPWRIGIAKSSDPNTKVGSLGVTPAQSLVSTTPLSYTVFFENMETANAPAQEVSVEDQLDVNTMDLDSFRLGPMSFGAITVIPAPGVKQYSGAVDLRPEQNLLVLIQAGLDVPTGLVSWYFASIDPDTLQFPEDPFAGFLPPNVNPPEGDGSVSFTVDPKAGLSTGTTICNDASIVFDVNEAILTPEWCNTIDETPPSSHVLPLAPTQSTPSFTVEWTGTDVGSVVADYTIFVSENGGPFVPFVSDTMDTSATFTGKAGNTYAFYSIARDAVGHVEDPPLTADAETVVGTSATEVPTPSATITATTLPTDTPTEMPTSTRTGTPTELPSTETPTVSATSTNTAVSTSTPTKASTSTQTAEPTDTPTALPTVASTATRSSTNTRTSTNTPTAMPSATASPAPIPCGDVDGDGRVTWRDVVAVAHALAFRRDDSRYDINGNGRVDARDLVIVAQQLGRACTSTSRLQSRAAYGHALASERFGEAPRYSDEVALVGGPRRQKAKSGEAVAANRVLGR